MDSSVWPGDAVRHPGRVLLARRTGHHSRCRDARSPLPRHLADSALHAPQAGFGNAAFYPDLFDKAAVLVCRLTWNHPLPDGNKRAAWAALAMFVDLNGGVWEPDSPDVNQAEQAMLAIAAGDVDEVWVANLAEGPRPVPRR